VPGVSLRLGSVSRRWVAAASVLGAALVVALTWQLAGGAACAAVRAAATSGRATFYDLAGGMGNCSMRAPADDLYVALGPSEYRAAAACGGYLQVTGPKGSVRVKVVDQCPECEPGHVDLSRKAFARIADPVQGIVSVRYRPVVDPGGQGRLSIQVKDGSSRFWVALLVDGAGNPLRKVEARSGGGAFTSLQRADFNFWIGEGGAGPGPFEVRVTDDQGHRVTARGVDLRPGVLQKTSARLYGAGAGSGAAASAGSGSDEKASATTSRDRKPAAKATTGATSKRATPTPTPAAGAADEAAPRAPGTTTLEDAARDEPAGATC
jgi:expansin (peptidoglycan-binding protein)